MTSANFPVLRIRALLGVGLLSLLVMAFAAARLAGFGAPRFYGTLYPDAPPAPAFALTDHRGGTTSLADFRGRPVLLFFGFTRCPDVCPLTLAKLTRVLREAEIGPDRVSVVLITVDPEHDTPARLAEYIQAFDPAITALTGERQTLEALFADYGVYAQPTTPHDEHATIAHTTLVFGIDRAGRLRVLIHAEEPGHMVENDIRSLLRLRE